MNRKQAAKGGIGMERTYIAIDLKSFYASVECVERHLDALTTNGCISFSESSRHIRQGEAF